mgnify:CR=1 FL=1
MKQFIFIAAAQAVILGSDPVFSSLEKDDGKKKNPFGDFYHAYEHDFGIPGTQDGHPAYERKIPEHFTNKHLDDMFMNSMLTNYAKEGKNPDGSPNGKFYLDREAGRRASEEVVATHLKLSGEKLQEYLARNFYETWEYYDVNHEDLIEADRMSTFFRALCHDANLNI